MLLPLKREVNTRFTRCIPLNLKFMNEAFTPQVDDKPILVFTFGQRPVGSGIMVVHLRRIQYRRNGARKIRRGRALQGMPRNTGP
jgi:hypothetical protein